jgi:hypothetical protein
MAQNRDRLLCCKCGNEPSDSATFVGYRDHPQELLASQDGLCSTEFVGVTYGSTVL